MFGIQPKPAPRDTQFLVCTTQNAIYDLFDRLGNAREYAWDIETTHPTRGKGGGGDDTEFVELGSRNEKVIGVSFCWNDARMAAYLPLYSNPEGDILLKHTIRGASCTFERVIRDLKAELEDPSKRRYTWNGPFDATWMRLCFGIVVPSFEGDGMIAHHLLDENRVLSSPSHKLKDCASHDLDDIGSLAYQYEQDLQLMLDRKDEHLGRFYLVPFNLLAHYGCFDAYATFRLVKRYEKELEAEGLDRLYRDILMPLLRALTEIRVTGVPVDQAKIEEVGKQLGDELTGLTAEIVREAGRAFDPGSPEQLSGVLFDDLRLTPQGERGASGYYSTKKEVLASLETAHPIVKLVQRHRRLVKLKGTYVDGLRNLLAGDRYYPDYKIHTTVSGRWTERLVVLLPREEKGGDAVKGLFVAPPNHSFLFRDLSQIELRIAAHISDDDVMVGGFCTGGPTYDPHAATAIRLFGIDVPAGEDPIKWVKRHHKPKRSIAKNCVDPTTIVWTDAGPRRIADVSVGARVWNGHDYVDVIDTYDGGIKPRVAVVTRRGVTVCSEDHRFATPNGSLVPARVLAVGQVLPEPDVPVLSTKPYLDLPIDLGKGIPTVLLRPTDAHAYFAGLFCGDGATGRNAAYLCHGSTKKSDQLGVPYFDWQAHLVGACDAIGLRTTTSDKGVYLGSAVMLRFLRSMELVAPDSWRRRLRVPTWVISAGRHALLSFLAGLFDTDGSVSTGGHLDMTTKDPVFAGQIAALLKSLALDARVEPMFNKTYRRWYYRIRLVVTDSWEMRRYLRHPGKRARLKAPVRKRQVRQPNDVLRVIPLDKGWCVDLMLGTRDHLYVAGVHLTHNCNFLSIYGGQEDRLGSLMSAEYPDLWPNKERAVKEARGFLAAYFEVHRGLAAEIKRTHDFAHDHGYVVNMFGRRRRLPNAQLPLSTDKFNRIGPPDERRHCYGRFCPSLWFDLDYREDLPADGLASGAVAEKIRQKGLTRYLSPAGIRVACVDCDRLAPCCYVREHRSRRSRIEEAKRQAFNFCVQSAAVDYTDLALVLIWREIQARGLRSRPVLQIHDSLGFLVPDDELDVMADLTREKMEHALDGHDTIRLRVPIASELTVGRSWGDEGVPSFAANAMKQCPACEKRKEVRVPTVTIGQVTPVGRCSRYQQMALECSCGWRWQHPAVFQSELT